MDDATKQPDEAQMAEAQQMLRQLVQVRLQAGATEFGAVAAQLGLPPEVIDIVEQAAAQVEGVDSGAPAIQPRPLSGLVSASGQPLDRAAAPGLIMPDGTPVRPQAAAQSLDGVGDEDETADLLTEDEEEEAAAQMFQELIGVRLVIGEQNFGSLAGQMEMHADAQAAIETAAAEIEQQIEENYPDSDEANTVRLLNARMMLGADRFSALAEQVGMPQEMQDSLEDIAQQIEAQQAQGDDDDAPPTLQV